MQIKFPKIGNPLKEDNGGVSTLRILLFLAFGLIIWMYLDWRWAFRQEVMKESPDYSGLTTLFSAMMISFAAMLFLKVLQKKFEQKKKEDKE